MKYSYGGGRSDIKAALKSDSVHDVGSLAKLAFYDLLI